MSHTITIEIEDHDNGMVSTVTQTSDRSDWTWMLYAFSNAVSGIGFRVNPWEMAYKDYDAVELSMKSFADAKFGDAVHCAEDMPDDDNDDTGCDCDFKCGGTD